MATLTPTLTLTGTAADFGAALSLSQSDTLIVGAPFSGLSRISIATSIQDISADLKTDQTAHTFVYLKNIDTSNIITISTATGGGSGSTDPVGFATLNPEEFMFLPLKGTVGLKATANNAPCVLEYAYFTRS
tara:strand:+ start:266 stop:661 length:396 start_codon:yes stop_codon:yes gene_type:complete